MQWVEGDKQFTWGHLELGSLGEVASRWWIQAACRKCPRLLWLPPRHRQVQSMPWRWWHHTREECSIGRKNKQIKGKFLGGEIGHQAPPCCCSVDKSCPALCNPVNCSMPGLPVPHSLPEFPQIRVHWVGDAIQSSHPLPPPSPPASNLSQHQSLFQQVGSSHQVTKVLKLQLSGSVVKNSPANAEGPGSIPGSGRCPGEGNGTHSSILAWRVPWTGEPGRLQSTGSQKSRIRLSV